MDEDCVKQPGGPVYAEGEGRVVHMGWASDLSSEVSGFRAVIEFPHGPPNLPMSVVFNGTPVTLSISARSAAESPVG